MECINELISADSIKQECPKDANVGKDNSSMCTN